MSKRNPKPQISVAVGDHVLLGATRASYPAHWYSGAVLWTEGNDLLVRRSNQNGNTWLETTFVSEVRAKGTFEELYLLQRAARGGVHVFQQDVDVCEAELERARDALFNKLEELAAAGLNVVPPDFDAIDADHAREQEAYQQAGEEAESTP